MEAAVKAILLRTTTVNTTVSVVEIMAATSLRKAIADDISMVMNARTVITACSKSIATAAMAHSAVDFSVVASNGRTVKAMADSAEVSSVTASSGDPGTLRVAISSAEATVVATAYSRVAMVSAADSDAHITMTVVMTAALHHRMYMLARGSAHRPARAAVMASSAEATAEAMAHSREAMASSAVTVSSVAESLHPSSVRTLENVALTIKSSPMTPMSRFA